MKIFIRALIGFCALLFCLNSLSAQRNWLTKQASVEQLQKDLFSIVAWRAEQKDKILKEIQALPDTVKARLIQNADKYLSFKWPNLPATTYLQFGQTGNRSHYEGIRRERRQALSALAIGELIQGKHKYLPALINGIWAICEESTWAYPAHLALQKKYSSLPNPGENILDLGNGSTAELMSWTYLLLSTELEQVSAILPKRIHYELEKRVMEPYLVRSDFWWMGLKGQSVNNWNPTVNSSVLLTALLVEDNKLRMDSVIHKTMVSVDKFINQYPEDGGCDEGPGYWSMAGGALIGYLSQLKSASKGAIDIASQPLIEKMGKFIYQANIDRNYFVNYGDAHATVTPNVIAVYAFGEACKNDTLKRFAAWFAKEGGDVYSYLYGASNALERFVDYLSVYRGIQNTQPLQPLVKESWFPDLQQLTVRSLGGSSEGLFLAAKGGTNGASHNHNDVGNFIIYSNGQPAIVDLGVGTYTKQTFSKDRYKIFAMQSGWHNLPVINGYMQKDGAKFKASDVNLVSTKKATTLTMDLAGAYPSDAGVNSWKRSLKFSGGQVELSETYQLKAFVKPSALSLITPLKVEVQKGRLLLLNNISNEIISIYFNPNQLKPTIETKELDDPSLSHSWGKQVYKVSFEVISHQLSGTYKIRFEEPK